MGAPDSAVRTLLRTYWSSAGWKPEPSTPPDELANAVGCGVMFGDERGISHDELVAEIRSLARALSGGGVGAAFLSSLSTRRLDLRSALGSFAVARHLPDHPFSRCDDGPWCAVCGALKSEEIDRNVLNFERFKWGGIRRLDLNYIWHDLDRFTDAGDTSPPSDDDRQLLRAVVDDLRQAYDDMTAARASKDLVRAVRSNAEERSVLLEILGVCSVLRTAEHDGFKDGFVRYDERPLPTKRFVEQAYPVCWWTGADGVRADALAEFGVG